MRQFVCSICGYIYQEAAGIPGKGIPAGTLWAGVPDHFACPLCGAPKSVFKPDEDAAEPPPLKTDGNGAYRAESLHGYSAGQVSAICSNLAKGCEKQRLSEETEAFNQLADYFLSRSASEDSRTLDTAARMLADDFAAAFPAANAAAKADADRGAMRSLVWSEKVSVTLQALLNRFQKEGDAMLRDHRIWVCDICGFVWIGDTQPEICPVCKVPHFKITEVERG